MGAEVIPFPCSRRAGKIRQTAWNAFVARTPRATYAVQRQAAEALEAQMRRAGVDEGRARSEVLLFQRAVGLELGRLYAHRAEELESDRDGA